MLKPTPTLRLLIGALLFFSALTAFAGRTLVGTWHWSDRFTDSVAERYLTLNADGHFVLADSYPGDVRGTGHSGWWRLERGALALNFWNADPSEEQPCHPDMALKIIQQRNDSLIVKRHSETLKMTRVR
jgi:hypothetical protein